MIRFDRAPAPSQPAPQMKSIPVPSPPSILLVDDDAGVRSALEELLHSEGMRVVTAGDGSEAARLFAAWTPDLLIVDLRLPGLDGWRVFDQLERRRPFIPCIIITGRRDQAQHATFAGVDALMEKPLNLPLLLETIRSLLHEPYRDRVARISRRSFATTALPSARA